MPTAKPEGHVRQRLDALGIAPSGGVPYNQPP